MYLWCIPLTFHDLLIEGGFSSTLVWSICVRMDVVGHVELLAACMESGRMDLAPLILEGMMKEVSSLFVEDVEVRFSPANWTSLFATECLREFLYVFLVYGK